MYFAVQLGYMHTFTEVLGWYSGSTGSLDDFTAALLAQLANTK